MTKSSLPYLNGYPEHLQQQVQELIDQQRLGAVLQKRYPNRQSNLNHNQGLYEHGMALKQRYLKKASPLSKIIFDDKITLKHQALGLHTYAQRQQGNKTKAKNEIRLSGKLKALPAPLIEVVLVHELAHLKEKDHDKSFYQLCQHMLPDYHQLEFDLRLYLTWLEFETDKNL